MKPDLVPPDWALPEGVDAPLWTYAHTSRLADEEDAYFRDHPLFATDAQVVGARFVEPGRLIDLGCGTGRLSLAFARRGFSVLGVDLSQAMLGVVARKAAAERLTVSLMRANLCRLSSLPDRSFDYAISMFSTLGMIRGRLARRAALAEAARILRPDGRFALHAHNLWLNLGDSQGRWWLASRFVSILRGRDGAGDRQMTYRGIPGMRVHLYRWNELRADLASAGFRIASVHPIDPIHARPIQAPWLLPSLRAGGWIVFARPSPRSESIPSSFNPT